MRIKNRLSSGPRTLCWGLHNYLVVSTGVHARNRTAHLTNTVPRFELTSANSTASCGRAVCEYGLLLSLIRTNCADDKRATAEAPRSRRSHRRPRASGATDRTGGMRRWLTQPPISNARARSRASRRSPPRVQADEARVTGRTFTARRAHDPRPAASRQPREEVIRRHPAISVGSRADRVRGLILCGALVIGHSDASVRRSARAAANIGRATEHAPRDSQTSSARSPRSLTRWPGSQH